MKNLRTINLRKYRKNKKISQKKMSADLGISQGYISKIENGEESPTMRMVYRFADYLNICPRDLIECTIECNEKNNCDINLTEEKEHL